LRLKITHLGPGRKSILVEPFQLTSVLILSNSVQKRAIECILRHITKECISLTFVSSSTELRSEQTRLVDLACERSFPYTCTLNTLISEQSMLDRTVSLGSEHFGHVPISRPPLRLICLRSSVSLQVTQFQPKRASHNDVGLTLSGTVLSIRTRKSRRLRYSYFHGRCMFQNAI
jgi:hypothetical protein